MTVDEVTLERAFEHWWSSDDAEQFSTPAQRDAAWYAFQAGYRRGLAAADEFIDVKETKSGGASPDVR